MLKWHGKLTGTILQMLLNCSTGFQAKKLGKKLVPQQSTSWFKSMPLKCILFCMQNGFSLKHLFQLLLDADGDILHTLPHGQIDSYWAYPGANKHGYLLNSYVILWSNNAICCQLLYVIQFCQFLLEMKY